MSHSEPDRDSFGLLRRVARIAACVGAIGSVGLTLRAGRHNNSHLLIALFTLWVLFPFAALFFANVISRRWPGLIRATLSIVTLVVVLSSLALYGYVALGPPRAKTAAPFLVAPPASVLISAIVLFAASLMSRRLTRRS